jgi:hypothetical protein
VPGVDGAVAEWGQKLRNVLLLLILVVIVFGYLIAAHVSYGSCLSKVAVSNDGGSENCSQWDPLPQNGE